MSKRRSTASLVLALALGAALSGCGNSTTTTATTTGPVTQQFVFTPTGASITAVPVTNGAFGTIVQSATVTGTTSAGVATANGSVALYSSETANTVEVYGIASNGQLSSVGSDTLVFGANTTESAGALALNAAGNVLYVAGNSGDIEVLAASGDAVAALTPVSGGVATANTTTNIGGTAFTPIVSSMQVVTVGSASVLLVAEETAVTPVVQAYLLNSDGSFTQGAATSTIAIGSGTTATGIATYTAGNGNFDVAVSTNGTTNNEAVVTLSSSGVLTAVTPASGEFNVATSANAEPMSGIYVSGTVVFAVGSSGDVQTVFLNTDGSLSAAISVASTVTVGTPLVAGGVIADGVDFFTTGSTVTLIDAGTASPSETNLGSTLSTSGGGAQSTITFQ